MQIRNIINRFRKNKKQGFTLVELVVNMAIIGIIAVMVTTLTGTTIKNFNGQKHKEDAIAVADLVCKTIEDNVKMAGAYKLDTHYDGAVIKDKNNVEIENGVYKKAQNNDTYFVYPTTKTDVQNYFSIFQLDNNLEYTKTYGKLYTINKTTDASVNKQAINNGATFYKTLVDGTGEYIKVYPLIPDDFYRGFNVNVRYEYLTAVKPQQSVIDASTIVLEDTNSALFDATFTQNTVKMYVDVYDGDSVIYAKTSTITFMQKSVLVDKGRNAWNDTSHIKDMICIR